jgi:hypothetical protein
MFAVLDGTGVVWPVHSKGAVDDGPGAVRLRASPSFHAARPRQCLSSSAGNSHHPSFHEMSADPQVAAPIRRPRSQSHAYPTREI